jgi:hypothetical protein
MIVLRYLKYTVPRSSWRGACADGDGQPRERDAGGDPGGSGGWFGIQFGIELPLFLVVLGSVWSA